MERHTLALFDVDTREPTADGTELVFRARVEPIRANLERIATYRQHMKPLTVATACLNAAPVEGALPETSRLIGMTETDIDWPDVLSRCDELFLEKQSHGCPEANICNCAYDVFRWNVNTQRLVRSARPDLWCVFGVSLERCVRSTDRAGAVRGRAP